MKKRAMLILAIIFFVYSLAPIFVYAKHDISTDFTKFTPTYDVAFENNDISDRLSDSAFISEYEVPFELNSDDYVTRAQAVMILVSGLGDELKAVKPADISVFADYQFIDPIFYNSLGLLVSLGAVNGSDDSELHANDYITRVEAFSIISRILSQDELPTDQAATDVFFIDVPDWAVDDILRLKNAGLIYGYGDGTLGANDFITYEQVVLMYSRLLNFQQALPSNSLYKSDYYVYVNERWLSETDIPDGYARWSNVEQLAQNNAYRIQNIIGEIITSSYIGNMPVKGSNDQKILDVYRSAANIKHRDSVGIEPIEEYLKMIDDISSITQLIKVLAALENDGFHSILPIGVNNDFKDSTRYMLSFESCYTGIEPSIIKSGNYEKVEKAYKQYIKNLLIISGESIHEADKSADSVTKLCIWLAEATMGESEWDNLTDIYNVYQKDTIGNIFSNINMNSYIKDLGYTNFDDIVVYDKALAKDINSLLVRSNLNVLKKYLKVALLDYSSFYLDTRMFDAYQHYINTISGVDAKITPDAYSISITQSLLGFELGEKYVERYFSADSKKEIESLATEIIHTFENRIENLEWMGEKTKETAIEKLEAISVRIGYPEYIRSYSNRNFSVRSIDDGGNLMENVIRYNQISHEQSNKLINENISVDKEIWAMTPQTVNAYYDRASNCIVIPAGILQAPYYSPNSSFEANLGGIGSVIAHEITHAFDSVGSQFDKNGNLNDWWLAEDFSAFNQICKKIISEYDKIEPIDGWFVDGKLTLNENIADIGGMACVLDIAGDDNENLDELFKAYARTYRMVCTDEYQKMLLVTDEHAPNKVRVNMVLSNFTQFLNLYRMSPEDPMYRVESERIAIW